MQMLFWTTPIHHTFSDNLQFLPQLFFANVLLFCPFFVFQKQVLTYVELSFLKIKKATAVETYFSWTNSETVPCGQGLSWFQNVVAEFSSCLIYCF